jgi:anti-sigma factor RsiW
MAVDSHLNDPKSGALLTCESMGELLSAFQDGELGVDQRRAVEGHLATCADCRAALDDHQRIGRMLRLTELRAVPAGLAGRIGAGLDMVDREGLAEALSTEAKSATAKSATAKVVPMTRRFGWPRMGSFAGYAAAAVAACVVSVAATWTLTASVYQSNAIERDVLNAHIRSLLQDSPVQVASSDQHTVRPWFAGRADFAPAVKDLATDGFPLVGGRLDYVADRRSGVLVYKRRLHVINVFMWPTNGAGESAPRMTARNGYNLLSWTRNNVSYSAVSDVNGDELRLLQGLL